MQRASADIALHREVDDAETARHDTNEHRETEAVFERALQAELARQIDASVNDAYRALEQQAERAGREARAAGISEDSSYFKTIREVVRGSNTFGMFVERFGRAGKWLASLAVLMNVERGLRPPEHEAHAEFAYRDEAADQLAQTGITDERVDAYTPGLSEVVYRGINPHAHVSNMLPVIERIPENLLLSREITVDDDGVLHRQSDSPYAEDAFRLYLGLPQEHGTFGVSDYQPKGSEDKYYYKINGWFERYSHQLDDGRPGFHALEEIVRTIEDDPAYREEQAPLADAYSLKASSDYFAARVAFDESHADLARRDHVEFMKQREVYLTPFGRAQTNAQYRSIAIGKGWSPAWISSKGPGYVVAVDSRYEEKMILPGDVPGNDVMTNFKISVGRDEKGEYISYYDEWDIGKPHGDTYLVESSELVIGKPYEIYDRVYFDRATWEPIQAEE